VSRRLGCCLDRPIIWDVPCRVSSSPFPCSRTELDANRSLELVDQNASELSIAQDLYTVNIENFCPVLSCRSGSSCGELRLREGPVRSSIDVSFHTLLVLPHIRIRDFLTPCFLRQQFRSALEARIQCPTSTPLEPEPWQASVQQGS
jgi:hypothetical protein